MGTSYVVLSERLQMLADMVTPGNVLVDVGCDHGFLSIHLVSAGVCPKAIAMDVRSGPLAGAERHIREFGLGEYIEVRLSDGLAEYRNGEAGTLVCAGMGGRLMEMILRDGMEKVAGMRELVLQPQSELPRFRAFLRDAGLAVTQEEAVFEEGKYYFAMKAVPGGSGLSGGMGADTMPPQELCDMFGGLLLMQRHPVLFQYLRQRESYMRQLAASLAAADSAKAGRRTGEVRRELEMIEGALSLF